MSRLLDDPIEAGEAGEPRVSSVRAKHGEIARRQGRAGAPGLLGLELQEGEKKSSGRGSNRRSQSTQRSSKRTSSRSGGASSKKSRDTSGSSRGDGGEKPQRQRSRSANEATGIAHRAGGVIAEAASNAAQAVADKAEDASTPHGMPGGGSVKGKMLRFAARKVAGKAAAGTAKAAIAHGAGRLAESAERRASTNGHGGHKLSGPNLVGHMPSLPDRLPIQRSVDVAVPLELAWQQWMQFDYFTEGAHKVTGVERDGDRLTGDAGGLSSSEWEAEVIEERPCESFAWQSVSGGDCAGLITFHRLSERLTRLELELDARPVGVGEALALALRVADRRAEAEMRRFKAHVELINPDVYEEILGGNGRRTGSTPKGRRKA